MISRLVGLLVAALVATIGISPAQSTTADLSAEVWVGALASNNFSSRVLAPGPITAPRAATATVACCLGMGGASITTRVAPLPMGASWSVDSSSLGGTASTFCQATCGELVVRAPNQTVGSVIVTCLSTSVSQGTFWVDVSGDGTREIVSPFTNLRREFRVCGTRDILVKAHVSGYLTGFSSELFELRVEIVPGLAPVATLPYGNACGATLGVADQPTGPVHNLAFAVTNGFPNGLALLLIGVGRTQIPVPGCDLHTSPLVVLTTASDPQGAATLRVPVHGVITGLVFQAQGLSFDANLQMRGSRGVDVTFRDC